MRPAQRLLATCVAATAAATASAVQPIDIIGHRGNSGEAPENTLVAIDQAFDRFASIVEADIRSSADGTAWLMHDATVNRTTDGSGSINALSDAQLRTLDAGSWFGPQYAGEPVPTLADAMAATAGWGALFLDLKETGLGPAIDEAIRSSGFDTDDLWLWVGSNANYANQLHALFPAARILWGGNESQYLTDPGYFDDLRDLGVWGFDVGYGSLTPGFVAAAQAEGFYVSTYTVNDTTNMLRAIEFGVDGMETDFPMRLYSLFDVPFDLNGDNRVDFEDWRRLLANQRTDLSNLSTSERFALGDLNNDGFNDHADFVRFKEAYIRENGAAAFSRLLAAPEPGGRLLLGVAGSLACAPTRRRNHGDSFLATNSGPV